MIDIDCISKHLRPSENKEKIKSIQDKGRKLAIRITASFNLIGRRALQFTNQEGDRFQALIHNEADDPTDYLIVHEVGVKDHIFEALQIEEDWVTNYIDLSLYDMMMNSVGEVLLEYINSSYSQFIQRNEGYEPEALSSNDVNLDSFAAEMARRKIQLSHQGNMRLAFQ